MIVHQVYALISEEKVQNICVCDNYEMANYIARASYGDEAFAVDCLQYRCIIGDIYRDGSFYRKDDESGEEILIKYEPTQEQQVETLNHSLIETELALVEQYEENLQLNSSITNVELAITELYERGLN